MTGRSRSVPVSPFPWPLPAGRRCRRRCRPGGPAWAGLPLPAPRRERRRGRLLGSGLLDDGRLGPVSVGGCLGGAFLPPSERAISGDALALVPAGACRRRCRRALAASETYLPWFSGCSPSTSSTSVSSSRPPPRHRSRRGSRCRPRRCSRSGRRSGSRRGRRWPRRCSRSGRGPGSRRGRRWPRRCSRSGRGPGSRRGRRWPRRCSRSGRGPGSRRGRRWPRRCSRSGRRSGSRRGRRWPRRCSRRLPSLFLGRHRVAVLGEGEGGAADHGHARDGDDGGLLGEDCCGGAEHAVRFGLSAADP